jgi:glycosyltransferase involved in cell wall biosynthesis
MAGGGAERQLTYLARELVQIGWDVHVAVVHGGPNLARLEASGATVHRISTLGNYDPRILLRLISLIRSVKPDVVQCWLPQMEVLGGLASQLTGTPWVFSERASNEAYPASFKMWLRRTVARRATAIVSNSHAGDRYWQHRSHARTKRYIIPNGLPLDEIAGALDGDAHGARATGTDPLLLNAGRFEHQKNFETFVRAVALVTAERPVQALCCGEGSLRKTVERRANELGLSTRVSFTGYTSNLWGLMKRADIIVSTSFFEGSPNVVLEAMAAGRPLVVSDIAEHREILNDETALFADPHSPQQFAQAILAALRDRAGAARRAQAARARVQRYSIPAIAREYIKVYREIAAEGRRVPQAVL